MSVSYYPCTTPESNKPLVILLPWLKAKPKHLNKYIDVYHQKGYDVLTTQVQLQHFLRPALCSNAVDRFLTELFSAKHDKRPLIFHSFSVGSFFLSNIHMKLLDEPERYATVSNRIMGYISDSITIGSTNEMIEGIGRALFRTQGVRSILFKGVLTSYFAMTRPWTVSVYEKLIELWSNYPPHSAPMLYYYSIDDPMSDPKAIMRMITIQKNNGRTIETMYWEKSAHAMHYIHHREDYMQALNAFLNKIDPENVKPACGKL